MYTDLNLQSRRIICTTDTLELGTKAWKVFTDSVTHIYANDCILAGPVTSKQLHLDTGTFASTSQGNAITTSGDDGKDNHKPGDDQANGHEGHHFYFSSQDFDAGSVLAVTSNGGNGARGYSGVSTHTKGGDGGNGGDGGRIKVLYNDIYRNAWTKLGRYFDDKKEKDFDHKVKFAESWLEDWGGAFTSPDDLVSKLKQIQDELNEDPITVTEHQLYLHMLDLNNDLDAASNSLKKTNEQAWGYKGGSYGHGGDGNPKGKNGRSGKIGSYLVTKFTPHEIRGYDQMILHPDQVSMTLRDAYALYFAASASSDGDDSLDKAAVILASLVDKLSFLHNLTSDDKLYKAYADREADIAVLASDSDIPTSISSMQNTLKQAKMYLKQITISQKDIYNHSPSWVPRGSYTFYQNTLDTLLTDFEKVEHNYHKYMDKSKKQQERRAAIEYAEQVAQRVIDQSRSQQKDIAKQVTSITKQIDTLTQQLPAKQKNLQTLVENAKKEIKDHFGLALKDFLQAVGQFAFMPDSELMGAITAVTLWDQADTEVEDDAGDLVNKDYLVSQFDQIDGTIDGLKEVINSLPDGSLKIDDPGANKLVAQKEKLMDLIGQYRSLLGAESLKNIRTVFDDYIQTVLNRNTNVLEYNKCIIDWLRNEYQVTAQEATLQKLQSKDLEHIDPELPAVAAFVQEAYFHTVDQIMRALYMATRALEFWTLDNSLDRTYFDSLRAQGLGRKGLSASLDSIRDDIMNAYGSAIIENSSSSTQSFGPDVPITVDLTANLEDDDFLNENKILYPIQYVTSSTKATGPDSSQFAGMYNIRITKVRFFLEGAQTDDDMLHVVFYLLGSETIVDSFDHLNTFTHNPLTFGFSYNMKTGDIQMDGDIFKSTDPKEIDFAYFGPFTTWEIKIPESRNKSLDLTGVTSARLEFTGWGQVYDVDESSAQAQARHRHKESRLKRT